MWRSRGWGISTWDWSLGKAATPWRPPLESQPGTWVVCGISGWSSEDVSERPSVGARTALDSSTGLLSTHFQRVRPYCHWPHTLSDSHLLGTPSHSLMAGPQRAEGCVRSGFPTDAGHPRALTGAGEAGMVGPHTMGYWGAWSGLPSSTAIPPWRHLVISELRS